MKLENVKYRQLAKKYKATPISQTRAERTCSCWMKYEVKFADLKRGWGMSCSKSCASYKKSY